MVDLAHELLGLIDDRATDYKNSKTAQTKTNITQEARDAYNRSKELPINDGLAPAAPAAPIAAAVARGVRVTWDPPPAGEFVAKTEVLRTNVTDGTTQTLFTDSTFVNVTGITAGSSQTVQIRHIDAFDLVGDWSPVVPFVPLHTKAEELELSVPGSVVVGGSLEAGGVTLDDSGIHLTEAFGPLGTTVSNMRPSSQTADWLTGPLGTNRQGTAAGPQQRFAGLAFFSYDNPGDIPSRGLILQADGVDGAGTSQDTDGQIILRATDGVGGASAANTAEIVLNAYPSAGIPGEITLDGTVYMEHDLLMDPGTWARFTDASVNGTLEVFGNVDFQYANALNFNNSRIDGGFSEATCNIGGQWSAQTTDIRVRRMGNFAFLSGRVGNNSGSPNTAGSVVCILPVGAEYRPTRAKYLVVPTSTGGSTTYVGQARIRIDSASGGGNIELAPAGGGSANDVGTGQGLSLDGVYYSVND